VKLNTKTPYTGRRNPQSSLDEMRDRGAINEIWSSFWMSVEVVESHRPTTDGRVVEDELSLVESLLGRLAIAPLPVGSSSRVAQHRLFRRLGNPIP